MLLFSVLSDTQKRPESPDPDRFNCSASPPLFDEEAVYVVSVGVEQQEQDEHEYQHKGGSDQELDHK